MDTIENPKVVSREEWITARRQHLAREKEILRLQDQLAAERRALPWVKIDKNYVFHGPNGPMKLGDLFGQNSQLLIYHFMLGPDWKEGCPGCSFLADHFDGPNLHLAHHDVSVVAVSRAPLEKIRAFKKRMDWKFPWVSSFGTDFNYDFHVTSTPEEMAQGKTYYNFTTTDTEGEEHPGLSVFYRDEKGDIYHTYSSYARGLEALVGTYRFLDLMPKGRNEPNGMSWIRHHDRYETTAPAKSECGCAS